MKRRIAAGVFVGALASFAVSAVLAQGIGAVRVTSARANIRSEGKDTAPVVSQVIAGTVLQLQAIEGDWFRVQLPPDPRLGGARVEAYISKKVAKLEPGSPTAAPPKPAEPVKEKEPESRDGMTVTLESRNTSTFLTPRPVRLVKMPAKSDGTVAELAAAMPAGGPPEITASGSTQITYVWTLAGATSPRLVEDRHPGFIVLFKDVPGMRPEDLSPVLVKVAAAADARVVALARGRADQAAHADPDWDLAKALRQDVVRADVDIVGRGVARVRPVADLAPGEYAIVLRPIDPKRKLAGVMLLGPDAEGRVFGAAWDFSVR